MQDFQYFCVYAISSLFAVSRSHIYITQHPSWMLMDHDKCGIANSDRIIGGKNATMGAYPWIARIAYRKEYEDEDIAAKKKLELSYRCGGTLVNRMYVITAAHCVANLPVRYKVASIRLGEHNVETNPDCENGYCAEPVQDFKPAQIVAHGKYNDQPFKNDIALIRLDRPVRFNSWVKPICLPSGTILDKDFVNEKAEVAGWGVYDINVPKTSVILQTIKLPIVPTERCAKAFELHAKIGPEQMCVGGDIGADSCGGDSGGPLMKVESGDSSPRYYLIGIVSFGAKNCGETTRPAVYSKISHYIRWILDNISP